VSEIFNKNSNYFVIVRWKKCTCKKINRYLNIKSGMTNSVKVPRVKAEKPKC
jgi:hypothetical protein